jgi:hypothetical protein
VPQLRSPAEATGRQPEWCRGAGSALPVVPTRPLTSRIRLAGPSRSSPSCDHQVQHLISENSPASAERTGCSVGQTSPAPRAQASTSRQSQRGRRLDAERGGGNSPCQRQARTVRPDTPSRCATSPRSTPPGPTATWHRWARRQDLVTVGTYSQIRPTRRPTSAERASRA